MKKAQVLAQITRLGKPSAQEKKKLKKMLKADLEGILAGLRQAQQKKKKQQATPKKRKSSKRRSTRKLPESVKKRAAAIQRGIKSGRIAAKQGKLKPSDYATGTTREKYDRFITLYKGARAKGKASKAPKATLLTRYQAISGTKYPYYLSRGYHVNAFNVGGGRGGPGLVRAIPGMSAKPFSSLTKSQQGKIVSFLNGPGKTLRSKGAKASVTYSQLAQVAKKKASRKSKKKGAANRSRW